MVGIRDQVGKVPNLEGNVPKVRFLVQRDKIDFTSVGSDDSGMP